MEVFDAVVPVLASAAAMGTYGGCVLDARAWPEHGTGALSHAPYAMLLLNAGGWLVYGAVARLASVVVSNAVGLVLALALAFAYARWCRVPTQASPLFFFVAVCFKIFQLYRQPLHENISRSQLRIHLLWELRHARALLRRGCWEWRRAW